LTSLAGYPSLSGLADLDPYAAERIDAAVATRMRDELSRFRAALARRALPPPPPKISDSPGEASDDDFGWPGLEAFCERLAEVLAGSPSSTRGIRAIGD